MQELTLSVYGFDEVDVTSQSGSSGVQMDSILETHTYATTRGQGQGVSHGSMAAQSSPDQSAPTGKPATMTTEVLRGCLGTGDVAEEQVDHDRAGKQPLLRTGHRIMFTIPRSKTSSSGTIPRSAMMRAKPRITSGD